MGGGLTMRTIHNYTIERESFEKQQAAQRYHAGLELTYRDKGGNHTVAISASYTDDISVFREGGDTIVLVTNFSLNYAGIEIYRDGNLAGEMFLQSDYDIKETIGVDDIGDRSDMYIAKVLFQHIY